MPPKKKSPIIEKDNTDETVSVSPPEKKCRTESAADAAPTTSLKGTEKQTSRGAAVTEADILKNTVPFSRKTSEKDFDASSMIKIVSWNVAGLRSILKKDTNELQKLFDDVKPDVVCLQETKLSSVEEARSIGVVPGYSFVDSVSTAKKGYSGTRTYVRDGIFGSAVHIPGFDVLSGTPKDDEEGRVLSSDLVTADGQLSFAILNSYVPNSGMTLDRLEYRTQTYDPMIRKLLHDLHKRKQKGGGGVIWTGDLNVAERDYDRYFASNFKAMQKVPGFTPEERLSFRQTLQDTNMVDGFRQIYPNASKAYTFWSAKFQSKAKGNGWRLDYFVLSQVLAAKLVDCFMLPDYVSSDHCPLVLWLTK